MMAARTALAALLAACLTLPAGTAVAAEDGEADGTKAPVTPAVSAYRSWSLPLFKRWSIRPYTSSRMAAADGVAYVGTREGRLVAVEASTGAVRWIRDLGGRISGGPAVGQGGRVYVGSGEGKVWALAADSGATQWQAQVSSEVITVPRLAAGMLFVRTADDFLWALRTADGGTRWSYNVEGRSLALRGGSRPAFADGRIFTGFSTGELVALESSDGSPAWRETIASPSGRTELERMVDVDAAPRVVDGMVIAAAYHGSVMALSVSSGQQLWKRKFSVHADPVVAGDRIFITTADSEVVALDRSGGGTLWTQKTLADAGTLSAPVLTERAVVVGDGHGRVSWLERDSGRLLGQIDLGPSAVHSPPLVVGDGAVLALTDQGVLNRVGLPTDGR
jgi:outer membrane protein assembly factor BamB